MMGPDTSHAYYYVFDGEYDPELDKTIAYLAPMVRWISDDDPPQSMVYTDEMGQRWLVPGAINDDGTLNAKPRSNTREAREAQNSESQ